MQLRNYKNFIAARSDGLTQRNGRLLLLRTMNYVHVYLKKYIKNSAKVQNDKRNVRILNGNVHIKIL